MKLKVDNAVDHVDLKNLFQYVHEGQRHYADSPAGQEHYKLLAYLSSQLPEGSKIGELGTLYGTAAVALAYNPSVSVVTCDPTDHIPPGTGFKQIPNIQFRQLGGLELLPEVFDARIIFLDVDPHDGHQEQVIYQRLLELHFKGLLVCDDIHFQIAMPGSMGMQNFWDGITLKKYDVSPFGHWSGTGIVAFDPETIDITY